MKKVFLMKVGWAMNSLKYGWKQDQIKTKHCVDFVTQW